MLKHKNDVPRSFAKAKLQAVVRKPVSGGRCWERRHDADSLRRRCLRPTRGAGRGDEIAEEEE